MASLATPESISSFQAFTGASAQEASMFLEMAGGNVEIAVGLFFGGGGGGGGFGGNIESSSSKSSSNPDWFNTLWGDTPPSEAWTEQALTFDPAASNEIPYSHYGLTQSKNGPCGVLAVLNAILVKLALEDEAVQFGPTDKPNSTLLAKAITQLLAAPYRNDSSSSTLQGGLWDGAVNSSSVNFQSFSNAEDLENFVLTNLHHYTRAGGLLLICYSVIQSRGVENVLKDVSSSGGECPLITGPFTLCTSELMSLILRGTANGNVGAYGPVGGKKIDWPNHTPVGMLSYNEVDHSIPVCDRLKSPDVPIWILHGRDHFTFIFQAGKQTVVDTVINEDNSSSSEQKTDNYTSADSADSTTSTTKDILDLYHYNGLPPAGPRMTKLTLTTSKHGVVGPAPDNHKEGVGTFMTPKKNSIFDIVQAHQKDKKERPNDWKTWRYEVVLHVDDPDGKLYGKGDEYPDGKGPKIFSQNDGIEMEDGRWRCATCYVKRNETMAFRLNDSGTTVCQHCNKEKDQCGWTMWMDYDQLTGGWQSSMNRQYQPKIKTLLSTKWIRGNIVFDDGKDDVKPPSI
jgi:hypothetical protein